MFDKDITLWYTVAIMIKSRSFKLNLDSVEEKAINDKINDLMRSDPTLTMKQIFLQCFTAQHGLVMPRPSTEVLLVRELRRMDDFMKAQLILNEKINAKVNELIDIVIDLTNEQEALKTPNTVSEFLSDQIDSLSPTYPTEVQAMLRHMYHHEPPSENRETHYAALADIPFPD